MKKAFCVLLAAVLVFSFCSCGAKPEEVERKLYSEVAEGSFADGRYYNEAFGIGFNPPEDWDFYGHKKMKDNLYGADIAFTPENPIFYDMMCVDSESGASIYIYYENMEETRGKILSEEEYILEMAENMEKAYSAAEVKILKNKIGSMKIDGENLYCHEFNMEINGFNIPTETLLRKTENYMAVMVLSYGFSPDKNEMVKGLFFE